jgi:hypothetical protein
MYLQQSGVYPGIFFASTRRVSSAWAVPSANHRNQQYAKIGEYAFSNDVVTD